MRVNGSSKHNARQWREKHHQTLLGENNKIKRGENVWRRRKSNCALAAMVKISCEAIEEYQNVMARLESAIENLAISGVIGRRESLKREAAGMA